MELQATFRENKFNELIVTQQNENGDVIVSGRDLHEFLESNERYSKWFERMSSYGFEENEDYSVYKKVHPQNLQELTDHVLKIDMAKEISMLQKNEKGKLARKYFIQLEKLWNSPEKVMERALMFAQKKVEEATVRVFQLEEKVDNLIHSGKVYTATEIGKELGMSGVALNKFLIEKGVQYKVNGTYVLKAKYEGKNYTSIKQGEYNGRIVYDRRFTGEGRDFILELFKEVK